MPESNKVTVDISVLVAMVEEAFTIGAAGTNADYSAIGLVVSHLPDSQIVEN